uniref:HMA domain-containing protein n=1 Tax=Alexandrium catenella TaxID=2925 RepID=A0A7S1L4F4_ALECA
MRSWPRVGGALQGAGIARGSALPGAAPEANAVASAAQGAGGAPVLAWEVAGLKCEGCAAGLKGTLQRLDGVGECSVSWGGPSSSRVEVRIQGAGASAEAVAKLCQETMAARPGLKAVEPLGQ